LEKRGAGLIEAGALVLGPIACLAVMRVLNPQYYWFSRFWTDYNSASLTARTVRELDAPDEARN
jgi:hypothetical protein